MDIRPIKNEEDYEAYLREIESLMDAEIDTPEGDRLDVLSTLVDVYEKKQFLFDMPDPIEALKFRMEQQNLKPKDLVPYIGQRSHVYEILHYKRPLSLRMAINLHHYLKIPAHILLQERI